MRIRPLTPEDAHHLVDLFDHMGPESRFLRFNMSLTDPDRELVWSEARRLASVDPEKDGAWLVFGEIPEGIEVPVGGMRFMRIDEDTAEASLAVRDDYQNIGIGGELFQFLAVQARKAGIKYLIATVQRTNRRIFHLLQQSQIPFESESDGGFTNITARIQE